jgi:general secretion pathway protein F
MTSQGEGLAVSILPSLHSGSISLDELIALADEMAALARAGVPLEQGLIEAAGDLSNRSGKLATDVAHRMRSGESFLHIIASSPGIFPPAYRAVVEAGARTGRLSSALEGLANSARRAAELRRLARAAIVYPLSVALLAYGLFILSILRFQPLVSEAYQTLNVPPNRLNRALVNLGETANIWGPALPLFVLLPVGIWWYWSGRAKQLHGRLGERILPTARLIKYGQIATFADVLALLVEHEAPLGESIVLAADASGDRQLARGARTLASNIERGGNADAVPATIEGCPPLLAWLLSRGSTQPGLAESLRRTAESYRRRAVQLDDRLRLYLPLVLTFLIGGTAVVVYALSVFVPWYDLLFNMSGYS